MKIKRVNNVLEIMKERGLSQLLINDIYSIYYLTGVYIDSGERFFSLLLKTNGEHKLFVNRLFLLQANCLVDKVIYSDTDSIMNIVSKYLDSNTPLGVDKELPAKFLLPLIHGGAAKEYKIGSLCIDQVRGIKDKEEQDKMRIVSKINDSAMERLKNIIIPGISEKEAANKLLDIYYELGADEYSFEPLIAFGENAAEPHHSVDNTILKDGDCILFDIGCKKNMYCADMTRTFFYKQVSEEHQKIYDCVKQANEKAIHQIKPGIRFKDIDQVARTYIEDAGYGDKFTHRLGHFIGIEVHEYGDVSESNSDIIQEGMIFSIEPGIYIQGDVGVRIEDLVMVTKDGCELLNYYSKVLEVII
ncbi:M24 family metallopeptidase [Alkalibaculum sp. M08DMB]|uniref:M24 family metallopeptidase n=1 Tax=Alkalibaculum sporogenes TaxID=2655001 RepID=A0A6A7K908_9FIRM|nr:Xaa-Pro peptidase family protein [Alkalibaculum sporogenes]MPW25989.1 M24 family metallopeptidase [Alkalibaculum sporogenes]